MRTCHITRPDCAVVSDKGAHSGAILRAPEAGGQILSTAHEEVSLSVEPGQRDNTSQNLVTAGIGSVLCRVAGLATIIWIT